MAQRATHLALNPPFFVFFSVSFFWGGVKGQVRWPQRATSLGPKPSFFFYAFPFLFAFKSHKKTWFPSRKTGHSCLIFSVSLSFSWVFFPPPLFPFLCLSLALFCLHCFVYFFLCFLLFSCFCFIIFLPSWLFFFHEKKNIRKLH